MELRNPIFSSPMKIAVKIASAKEELTFEMIASVAHTGTAKKYRLFSRFDRSGASGDVLVGAQRAPPSSQHVHTALAAQAGPLPVAAAVAST